MRVLQITAFSGWGCTGRIALGIHNTLVSKGHESIIAWGRINTAPSEVPTIKIGNRFDQQVHGLYTRITDKCGFGSQIATKKLIKQIDELRPDLIQFHILHGYYINLEILFNYIRNIKIPIVWTFHDCWAFTGHCPYFDLVGCEKWKNGCYECPQKSHHPTSWLFDNSTWNWNKKRELFCGVDDLTIVTPSRWLESLVKESFLKSCKTMVINNGINLKDFKPTKGELLNKFHLQDSKIILGVSSTWAASKGLNDFCELASVLPKEYRIVLVGLNDEQIEALPESIIGIKRTDSVKELAELYTAASLFVNPTYEDNFPTTNLEALACGTPVVTYQTGGSTEAAGDNYGKIIPQGDKRALFEYIISCEWQKISSTACVKHATVFDEKKRFAEYVNLYQEILQEKFVHE